MTMIALIVAFNLIALPGAHGHTVYVNPREVVSVRTAPTGGPYAPDIHCLIQTSDGKVVGSTDKCEVVTHKLARRQRGSARS
jgi:ketosteroid isomerase-like protein